MSPYVTECPYCGTRLRKRAPKLERVGDEVRVREGRRAERRRRKAAERRGRLAERAAAPRTSPRGRWSRSRRPRGARRPAASSSAPRTSRSIDLGAIVGPVGRRVVALPRGAVRLRRPRLPVRLRRSRSRSSCRAVERRVGSVAAAAAGARLRRARDARRRRARLDASATGSSSPPGGNGIALGVARRLARDPRRRAPRRPDRRVRPDRGRGRRVVAPAAAAGRGLRLGLGRARRRRWSAPRCGLAPALGAAVRRAVSKFTPLTDELHGYMVDHGARQDEVLRRVQDGDRGDGRRSRSCRSRPTRAPS